ncbi:MAG: phosphoribosylanthranilate isomerase [Euryarchaeota archaeon]
MVRVKICGITRARDARLAEEAGADAIGCVTEVPVPSPRSVNAETANEIFSTVSPFVSRVMVLMDDLTALERVEEATAVQLHGTEDPSDCERARELGYDVIKTVWVDSSGRLWLGDDRLDDARLSAYLETVDALLLDTRSETGGGSGRTHDWTASAELADRVNVPVILAGGLTPDNVERAVRTVRPHAVDASSGVEREPGVKDPEAVRAFVRRAKHA